jgi:tetratricopeptide (TPR) repeat protein
MANALPPPGPMATVFEEAKSRAASLINAGQRELAIILLRDLLKQRPKDVQALQMLAVSLQGNEDMAVKSKEPENLRLIRFASQLAPGNPEVLTDYALICRSVGQTRDAFRIVDQALAIDPTHTRAVMFKARLLQGSNRIDEALDLIEAARASNRDPLLAVCLADLCLHRKLHGQGIAAARPVFDDPGVPTNRRIEAAFLLGHLHDALGEYDTAFHYYKTGNTMQGPEPASDFDRHIAQWSRDRVDALPPSGADGTPAVMVIGMPRSGTTLTEMILSAHPKIAGVGESTLLNRLAHRNPIERLTDKALIDAYAREYLDMLRSCSPDPGAARVVDKMPENFIYLALAARMLPGMHVIHCRRDARDTCLSIYFQQFGPWIKYAKSLESVADQYRGYLRLMDHWRAILDIAIHDSVYEDLTADPEPRIRAMLDHIRMPFHPACLEHHKSKGSVNTASISQVRRPIYQSSRERWRNYEKHIGPLLERLEGV